MNEKKSILPSSLLHHTPWEQNTTPIWPASTFLLRRNLARQLFPNKMNEKQMQTVLGIIKDAIFESKALENPSFVKAEELSPTEKEFLFEHFLIADSFQNAQSGQGFIIDQKGECLTEINIQDHLTLCCIDCNADWKNSWKKLTELESLLSKRIDFAYNPKFGYLTANPFLSGTALQIQIYLHLPALIHTGKLQSALENFKEHEIEIKGISGNLEEMVGDLIILQNRYTLGITEESILHLLHTTATKMMQMEKQCRDNIKEQGDPEIKDKVSRAFGLLAHSYKLQTKEALSALSFLKLGIDLDWIEGLSNSKINELLFKCRRAHLIFSESESLPKEEISHKRSEFLHGSLKDVQLKI
ncbi:MAG: protein arginine kinase [Simkaniaceae bacterium]